MKNVFSAVLVLVLIVSMMLSGTVLADTKEALPDSGPYSLSVELQQSKEAFAALLNIDNKSKTTALKYIPKGARILEVTATNAAAHVDYILNGTRCIVTYYIDGSVDRVSRGINSDQIFISDSASKSLTSINRSDRTITLSRTEEEVQGIMNALRENDSDYAVSLIPDSRATRKTVYPKKYTQDSDTKPYKKRNVLDGTVAIPALLDGGYPKNQRFIVYETQSYHVESNKVMEPFDIGERVSLIATFFDVAMSTAKRWLDVAGVAYSTLSILADNCKVVDEQAFNYLGGKECGIYDPTEEKAMVETYSDWGDGKIVLTWKYSNGYHSPDWSHSRRSPALQIANTTIRNEGKDVYNQNIEVYGYWKHGRGRFGY